jgi:prepilin-type N-terminal cleavage/methylation domain-containing protein
MNSYRFLRTSRSGMTLIELMAVVAIIGILAGVAVPQFGNLVERSQGARRRAHAEAFRKACSLYFSDHNDWPTSGGATHCFAPATVTCFQGAYTGDDALVGALAPYLNPFAWHAAPGSYAFDSLVYSYDPVAHTALFLWPMEMDADDRNCPGDVSILAGDSSYKYCQEHLLG